MTNGHIEIALHQAVDKPKLELMLSGARPGKSLAQVWPKGLVKYWSVYQYNNVQKLKKLCTGKKVAIDARKGLILRQ